MYGSVGKTKLMSTVCSPLQAARVRPGQFLFVNVPTIDRTGWHPFTIAHRQLSDDGLTQDLYLHIKPRGAWTKVWAIQQTNHVPSVHVMHSLKCLGSSISTWLLLDLS